MNASGNNGTRRGRGLIGVLVTLIIIAGLVYFYFKKVGGSDAAGDDAAKLRQEAVSNPKKAYERTRDTVDKAEGRQRDAVNEVLE